MRKNIQPCSVCGTNLRMKSITYTQEINGKVYFVADVPAQECPQCGEQYLTPETVEVIRKAITQSKAQEIVKVPLYHFPRFAI